MATLKFRVHGLLGHRQRVSFFPSHVYDYSSEGRTRIIEIRNSDLTGTNDYSEVIITMDSEEECQREMFYQSVDGFFEDSRVGEIEEVV